MAGSDLFAFAESEAREESSQSAWKILSVEDDLAYQASLLFSLRDIKVQDRPLEVLTANSVSEAAMLLSHNADICVILLDVVMEEDDAGLRLANTIREVLGNAAIRIVLLTGQPGMAPRSEVMSRYDIDEYWNKSDLTRDTLFTIINANIRTWHYLNELIQARNGLQMVVDAARSISSKQNLSSFTQTVLDEIGHIIGVKQGGIVCVASSDACSLTETKIVAASGSYSHLNNESLDQLALDGLEQCFLSARQQRSHQFGDDYTVLYFEEPEFSCSHYLVLIHSQVKLSDSHINLLRVFSENISSGFTTVALVNRLSDLAYRDQALGSHNRNWLLRELAIMPTAEMRNSELVMVDVDNFSAILVTFGEHYCEALLAALFIQLTSYHPDFNSVARTNADSFTILFNKEHAPSAQHLWEMTNQRLVVEGTPHHLSLSVTRMDLGLMTATPPNQILQLAESALSIGRSRGEQVIDYRPEILETITSSYRMMKELQYALENNELFIVLQPKVQLDNLQVVGFEALLRWKKEGRFIPPDQFIPIAETSGLISAIDRTVVRQAIGAVQQLQQAGHNLPVAFNASCIDLRKPGYIDSLLQAIEESRIDTGLLEIEVTESEAMQDYDEISPLLEHLVKLGMGVSIDDFGTGYSSLAHVANLSATTLKIDKSFVSRLGQDLAGEHVVEMVIRLCERFHFKVVAEGVETEAQRQLLMSKRCHVGQGYLFSPPLPITEAIAWLQNWPPQG